MNVLIKNGHYSMCYYCNNLPTIIFEKYTGSFRCNVRAKILYNILFIMSNLNNSKYIYNI